MTDCEIFLNNPLTVPYGTVDYWADTVNDSLCTHVSEVSGEILGNIVDICSSNDLDPCRSFQ